MAPAIANFAFSGFFRDKDTHKPPASGLSISQTIDQSVNQGSKQASEE